MYYYNHYQTNYENNRHQNYYNNQPNQHHYNSKRNVKNTNFVNKFHNSQKYMEYESNSTPYSYYEFNQFHDNNYNRSLSSSFDSDDSSHLTASLSSSTSSLEIQDFNYSSPIWSSALYSPSLHPTLFESWSSKMNKSIMQLREELKNYDFFHNELVNNQYAEKMNNTYYQNNYHKATYCTPTYNYHQRPHCDQYQSEQSTNETSNLISFEDMTLKVDSLLNNGHETQDLTGLKDVTNKSLQNTIHVFTSNDSLEQEVDDKSTKSASPKVKFTAPRFEKKWLKQIQTKSNNSYNYSQNNEEALSTKKPTAYSPNSSRSVLSKKAEFDKSYSRSVQQNQGNKWNGTQSSKSNPQAYKYNYNNKSQAKSGNDNENSNCNGANYTRVKYQKPNGTNSNQKYKYRPASKSRA